MFVDGTVDTVDGLLSRLALSKMPPMWTIVEKNLLTCKLPAHEKAPLDISVSIMTDLSWNVTVGGKVLQSTPFSDLSEKLSSVS